MTKMEKQIFNRNEFILKYFPLTEPFISHNYLITRFKMSSLFLSHSYAYEIKILCKFQAIVQKKKKKSY